jgi:hypothetical protein
MLPCGVRVLKDVNEDAGAVQSKNETLIFAHVFFSISLLQALIAMEIPILAAFSRTKIKRMLLPKLKSGNAMGACSKTHFGREIGQWGKRIFLRLKPFKTVVGQIC